MGLRLRRLWQHFGGWIPTRCHRPRHAPVFRAYILTLIGSVLCPNKSRVEVRLFLLSLVWDLEEVGTFAWGSAILSYLYRELCCATPSNINYVVSPLILLQVPASTINYHPLLWELLLYCICSNCLLTLAWLRIQVGRPDRLKSWRSMPGLSLHSMACKWGVLTLKMW